MSIFTDGLTSLINSLTNKRNPLASNSISHTRITDKELTSIYKTGIGNRICSIKSGYAMRGIKQFDKEEDENFFRKRLRKEIRLAARYMLAYGRCIILINEKGADHSKPKSGNFDPNKVQFNVFSGDMVSVNQPDLNLNSDRYYKPTIYNVRGHGLHYTRVIDFTYVRPIELELPFYQYGGISEFELIHEQLVQDGLVTRSGAFTVEKGSRLIYKVKGFKQALQMKKEQDMVNYFSSLEDLSSVSNASLMDIEDEVATLTQQLAHLAEVSDSALRRLAMVTGIPLAWLVGENVKGLNATGDNERLIFWENIGDFYETYIQDPVNDLMARLGKGEIQYKNTNGTSEEEILNYDNKVIDNAIKLQTMGEDFNKYLVNKSVVEEDNFENMFGDSVDED